MVRLMKMIAIGLLMLIPVAGVFGFADELPEAPGRDVVVKACTGCHTAGHFTQHQYSKEDWKATVETMIMYGADVKGDQMDTIVNYLTKVYGLKTVSR